VAGSEQRLREVLAPVRDDYAFVVLDCPPSLGPLTVNALVAADRVIVPVQTEYFALEGLAGLLRHARPDPARAQPAPHRRGMLLTMHDARTKLAQDVEREVRTHFPSLVFDTVIPRNVRLGEAPSFGRPVIHHDPALRGAPTRTSSSPRSGARG
jgi:chromosome partitioning protein